LSHQIRRKETGEGEYPWKNRMSLNNHASPPNTSKRAGYWGHI
jgi:hypothetical protein